MVGRYRCKVHPAYKTLIGSSWTGSNDPVDWHFYPMSSMSECFDNTNPGPPYKQGGPLTIASIEREFSPSQTVRVGDYYGSYHGRFIPVVSGLTASSPLGLTTSNKYGTPSWSANAGNVIVAGLQANLEARGSTGYSRAKPGKPIIDLGVGISELRDIPAIPGRQAVSALRGLGSDAHKRASFFRSLGKEYLNEQFGWEPFLRDMWKITQLGESLTKQLAQLRRDNGKGVRRRVTLNDDNETVINENHTGQSWNLFPSVIHPFYVVDNSGTWVKTTTITDKTWFEARFRYYIPDFDSDLTQIRLIAALLGLNPSAQLLWNATPWTWLIDWCNNMGDLMSNLNDAAAENLCSSYSYVMQTTRREVRHTCSQKLESENWSGTVSCSYQSSSTLKTRIAAGPFGFGMTPADLSGRQKGVLAALGISRHW